MLRIVERPGSNLFRVMSKAMKTGELRTFALERGGKRVVHKRYPGYMNWSYKSGVITGEIRTPRKEGAEWQFLSALIGMLARKYAPDVEVVEIEFDASK
ncbi:MAG TPA: hypothetical protein VNK96_00600 [Fimbriimonadales bacterium]|nr:hypothetical protein [Fimbriimonadales bacterium]